MSGNIQNLFSGGGDDAGATDAPEPGGAQAGGGDDGLTTLQMLRGGTSAVSALSTFGQAMNQKTALKAAAYQERLAASEEYAKGQDISNGLMRQYQRVAGAQQTTAAASGVDIASGSVQAAQQFAQGQFDRQDRIVRGTANMNAQLRLARAAALAQAGNSAGFLGVLDTVAKVGQMVASVAGAGG